MIKKNVCLAILAILGLSACYRMDVQVPTGQVGQSQTLALSDGMVRASDLPFGWGHRRITPVQDPNCVGITVRMFGDDPVKKPYINFHQEIRRYASSQESRQAYQELSNNIIGENLAGRDGWPEPIDESLKADQFCAYSLSSTEDGHAMQLCELVARYDCMVVWILTSTYEEKWLTMEQLRSAIHQIDQRTYAISAICEEIAE